MVSGCPFLSWLERARYLVASPKICANDNQAETVDESVSGKGAGEGGIIGAGNSADEKHRVHNVLLIPTTVAVLK